jgi:hypothetical protein
VLPSSSRGVSPASPCGCECRLRRIAASRSRLPLCEASDATEIAAEWSAWAKSLALPRLLEQVGGQLESVDPATAISPAPRRRGSAVAKRRTRFARRRRMGVLQRLATTYRDEREIVCYE